MSTLKSVCLVTERGWRGVACLAVSVCAAQGALAPAAQATFPGRNGQLSFDIVRSTADFTESCSTVNCETRRIYVLVPGRRHPWLVPTCDSECQDGYPAWSPRGDRLAFTRTLLFPEGSVPETRTAVGTYERGRGSRILLQDAGQPAWSPSGRRLIFGFQDGLFTAAPDGSALRRVTKGGDAEPDWSSRGDIVFSRRRGRRYDLYRLRSRGRPRRVMRTRDGLSASWSPDGRRLAFTRARKGGLYVVSAGGERLRRVAGGDVLSPAWSPDGDKIAFIRNRSIFTVRVDASQLRRVYRLRIAADLGRLTWRPRPR